MTSRRLPLHNQVLQAGSVRTRLDFFVVQKETRRRWRNMSTRFTFIPLDGRPHEPRASSSHVCTRRLPSRSSELFYFQLLVLYLEVVARSSSFSNERCSPLVVRGAQRRELLRALLPLVLAHAALAVVEPQLLAPRAQALAPVRRGPVREGIT